MNTLSQQFYSQYSGTYYKRVQSGYLHASPEHYNIVGRPNIGTMTEQITESIMRVNNYNKKQSQLDKIIKQQENKELSKLKAFVNVYNDGAEKPIVGNDVPTIIVQINKLISEKGFKANSPYQNPKVKQAIETINITIDSFFRDSEVKFSSGKVNNMTPNEFMALYEISQDILMDLTQSYRTEPNIILKEVYAFPIRKIQGFLKDHFMQYEFYSNKAGKAPNIPDNTLNDILEIIGVKSWGGRDARKTAAQVKSSFKGSARGGANQLQGVTLERTISGYVDDTDVCGDVANLIKGLVEGKVTGRMVGNRQDQFKKQQKIDIEWSFNTTDEQHRKINLSSKVHTGSGDIVIHSGGSLDTYISRFAETQYSKPIAKIFSNRNFRYFFANEFYSVSRGGSINAAFRNAVYNAIKVNIPLFLGVELDKKRVDMFDGVDFMNVNQTLIPISSILKRMRVNLKNYEKITEGMSITLDAGNTGGNFLTTRKALLKQIPRAPYENYYTNKNLMSQGYQDMNSYISHIKIGINLTSSIIRQSINEATGKGVK